MALFVCLIQAGCSTNPFPQVKVDGRITYDDGSVIPAERIRIWFRSQAEAIDANTHPRPASALVNPADGTFEGVTTYKYLDGLIRGEHQVFLDITPTNVVPPEYLKAKSSPLRISTDDAPLHIMVPKP